MSLESQLTKLNKLLEVANSRLDALLHKAEPETVGVELAAEGKPSSSTSEPTDEASSAPAAEAEKPTEASTEATVSAPGDAAESSGEDLKEKMRGSLIAVREQEGGNDKPREIMAGVGAASIGKIEEKDYQAIIDACDAILL